MNEERCKLLGCDRPAASALAFPAAEGYCGYIHAAQHRAGLLAEAEEDVATMKAAFVEYKAQVRERAIEAAKDENWCREGLNQALTDLGLDPVESEFTVRVSINAHYYVSLGVSAASDSEAENKVDAMTESEVLKAAGVDLPDGWSVDGIDIDEIEED